MKEVMSGLFAKPVTGRTVGMSHDEADALLAIDSHLRSPSPEWVEFIGETLSTWLVEHRAPAGIVDDAKARWLLDRIDAGGEVQSPAALALLRRCCVKAGQVPNTLIRYLRAQELRLRVAET